MPYIVFVYQSKMGDAPLHRNTRVHENKIIRTVIAGENLVWGLFRIFFCSADPLLLNCVCSLAVGESFSTAVLGEIVLGANIQERKKGGFRAALKCCRPQCIGGYRSNSPSN